MNIKPICIYPGNKVLPEVYDDALSYYEDILALQTKMNELVEAINTSFVDLVRASINKWLVDSMYEASLEKITITVKEPTNNG